jgi:hypothetical protein
MEDKFGGGKCAKQFTGVVPATWEMMAPTTLRLASGEGRVLNHFLNQINVLSEEKGVTLGTKRDKITAPPGFSDAGRGHRSQDIGGEKSSPAC